MLQQVTTVFDALLTTSMGNPEPLGRSTLHTVEELAEVLGLLLPHLREPRASTPLSARMLLLDDDPAANQQVLEGLRHAQLDGCSTEDSIAAWQWINSEQFDLVLLRMEMPVLNGMQLCERLRKIPGYRKTPVIFIAGQDDPQNQARCDSVGAADLIAKPILPQELTARVVTHLVQTRMQKVKKAARTSHRKRPRKTPPSADLISVE